MENGCSLVKTICAGQLKQTYDQGDGKHRRTESVKNICDRDIAEEGGDQACDLKPEENCKPFKENTA